MKLYQPGGAGKDQRTVQTAGPVDRERAERRRLTRREFLVASAGLLAIGLGGSCSGAEGAESPLLDLGIFHRGYPRAFFFRKSEALARRGVPYPEWEETFLPLNGIIGKVLQEEIGSKNDSNLEYFTRFKERNPEKVVLLHFNGRGRNPDYAEGFFAGHWIYKVGTSLTRAAAENGDDIVLYVDDPTIFSTEVGRYGDRGDDVGIAHVGEDGKPDWQFAEQVKLVSVDHEAGTLTVERGSYGTEPLYWPEGSYVAPHVTQGPWGSPDSSNLLWSYNISTLSPRDAQGRNCIDALVDDLAGKLGLDGVLSSFDGIEFDVFGFEAGGSSEVDVDADGVADAGSIDGINTYGLVLSSSRRSYVTGFPARSSRLTATISATTPANTRGTSVC